VRCASTHYSITDLSQRCCSIHTLFLFLSVCTYIFRDCILTMNFETSPDMTFQSYSNSDIYPIALADADLCSALNDIGSTTASSGPPGQRPTLPMLQPLRACQAIALSCAQQCTPCKQP